MNWIYCLTNRRVYIHFLHKDILLKLFMFEWVICEWFLPTMVFTWNTVIHTFLKSSENADSAMIHFPAKNKSDICVIRWLLYFYYTILLGAVTNFLKKSVYQLKHFRSYINNDSIWLISTFVFASRLVYSQKHDKRKLITLIGIMRNGMRTRRLAQESSHTQENILAPSLKNNSK